MHTCGHPVLSMMVISWASPTGLRVSRQLFSWGRMDWLHPNGEVDLLKVLNLALLLAA